MFFDDKKKIATTIMSKRLPSGEKLSGPMTKEEVNKEAGEVDPLHLAAQDVLAAHHEKSPHKLMESLSNFINLHQSHENEFEGGEEVDE